MTIELIPDDCLPFGGDEQKIVEFLRGPTTRLVAYCVEPGCRCLDTAGVFVGSANEAPTGYQVREEIIGGTHHGMTPQEVLAQRDAFNRALGE